MSWPPRSTTALVLQTLSASCPSDNRIQLWPCLATACGAAARAGGVQASGLGGLARARRSSQVCSLTSYWCRSDVAEGRAAGGGGADRQSSV